jgi:hypothetical protein
MTIDSAVSPPSLLSWHAHVNSTLPSNLLQLNSRRNSSISSSEQENIPCVCVTKGIQLPVDCFIKSLLPSTVASKVHLTSLNIDILKPVVFRWSWSSRLPWRACPVTDRISVPLLRRPIRTRTQFITSPPFLI